MTKKHFQKLAEIIKGMIETNTTDPRELANKIADLCKKENPRFSKEKFLKICGV